MITRERLGILAMVFIAATLGGGVAGYLISAATVEAAAAPRVVSARKFVLLDQAGKTRAQLDITNRGVAQLAIMDGSGALRAGLGVARDGAPGLGLYDSKGKTRVEVAYIAESPRIRVFSGEGTPVIAFGVGPAGGAGMALYDRSGKERASYVLAGDGSPTLRMFDTNGSRIGLAWAGPGTSSSAQRARCCLERQYHRRTPRKDHYRDSCRLCH